MATMNVSLPDSMKKWVNTQVKTGRFGNASDYVRDLIRRDQDLQGKITEIRAKLELEEKTGKTKSIKAKGEITRSEKTKTVIPKRGSTKRGKKDQSTDNFHKNVLAQVKKNWRSSD